MEAIDLIAPHVITEVTTDEPPRSVSVLSDVGQVARTAEVVIQTATKIAEVAHAAHERRTRENWSEEWGLACANRDAMAMSRLLAERAGNPDLRVPLAAADDHRAGHT